MLNVVFATRNRAATLANVLDSYRRLIPPEGGWRLVVVDNGSIDDTPGVLAAAAEDLPLLALHEPSPGKNRALNRALPHLDGDLAVFTDDDVLPDPAWLCALRAAADVHPDTTLFGGTVLPAWSEPRPAWLREDCVDFGVLYSQLRRPSGPCDFRSVWGPNMAVRRAVFDDGHRFDEVIGPNAAQAHYRMGSESSFNARLQAAGATARFVAEAVVHHIVRPEQMTERWILDRAYRHGLGVASYDRPGFADGPPILGLPRGVLKRRVLSAAAAAAVRFLPPSPRRLHLLFQERWYAGVADHCRQERAS
ncbi:MAG TPA: glycosyltransferase [Azospirillum sp.]|nr:glycosyltransferase [Azospirillum sp.]